MKKFYLFVGARPNFMKAAPLCSELKKKKNMGFRIFNSHQHYNEKLNDVFVDELMKEYNVENMNCVLTDNAIKNTEIILFSARKILKENIEDVRAVILFGDVTTTFAVALAAASLSLPIIHVEAGLRSFDITMPEELHRITVDNLSEILFAPAPNAVENLKNEGIDDKSFFVGNIMIDSLVKILPRIRRTDNHAKLNHIVVTFHRPENVDDEKKLKKIIAQIDLLSKYFIIHFFIHPRTNKQLIKAGLMDSLFDNKKIKLFGPASYSAFIEDVCCSSGVITDSGGIQEETSFLGIPCFTVRNNTERPETIELGTNELVSCDDIVRQVLKREIKFESKKIPFWDGKTAERIVEVLNTLS